MKVSAVIEHLKRLQDIKGDIEVVLVVQQGTMLVGAWPLTGITASEDFNAIVVRHEDLT